MFTRATRLLKGEEESENEEKRESGEITLLKTLRGILQLLQVIIFYQSSLWYEVFKLKIMC